MSNNKCKCDEEEATNYVVSDFTTEGFESSETSKAATQLNAAHSEMDDLLALQMSACVGAHIKDGKLCFTIPIYGDFCINLPFKLPVDANVKVCVETCTKWVVPTGVRYTAYYNDKSIMSGTLIGAC